MLNNFAKGDLNMEKIYYRNEEYVNKAIEENEPLLVLISFDGSEMIIGELSESVEHNILLKKVGKSELDIDKYFRIVVDGNGADWTFVCPPNYKSIADKTHRIANFYKDGFSIISSGLLELGLCVGINIPIRYARHVKYLKEDQL